MIPPELLALLEEELGADQVAALTNARNYTTRGSRYLIPLGVGAGAIYAAYLGIQALLGDPHKDYLSASALGKRGKGLEFSLFKDAEEMSAQSKATVRSGTYYGELVADHFGLTGAESEVKVIDERLGVKGFIDVLLPGNIPVEVKTISSVGFDRLSRPLEAHASQLNFYLHAQEAQYGYVLYLDGMDPSRVKAFRQGYQPGRLIADIEAARSAMLENPERITGANINWMTSTYQTSPAYLRGIRHSSGSASSFESIRPSPEFPGGRMASVVQASKYRRLGPKVSCTPTMGLTIRKHETAIGHKSRGSRAKRVGRNHCNGSRSYR